MTGGGLGWGGHKHLAPQSKTGYEVSRGFSALGRALALVAVVGLLGGCVSTTQHAPVVDRAVMSGAATSKKVPGRTARTPDSRPSTYTVQKGDTLYGISFEYGFDYREVAEWNGIEAPFIIRPGQQIRFGPGLQVAQGSGPAQVVVIPLKGGMAESKAGGESTVKSEPKAIKLPYSEHALQGESKALAKIVAQPVSLSVAAAAVPAVTVEKSQAEKTPAKAVDDKKEAAGDDEERVEWGWPAHGKLVGEFSENASAKGVDIAGKNGQAVLASAAGKVVYSGSGLRGYGKLIIIKHNKTYLSAYAHNSHIFVKEGQSVTKGQKIAEMGDSDADRVKLHFEIRRFGKPVDPMKYLSGDGAV